MSTKPGARSFEAIKDAVRRDSLARLLRRGGYLNGRGRLPAEGLYAEALGVDREDAAARIRAQRGRMAEWKLECEAENAPC